MVMKFGNNNKDCVKEGCVMFIEKLFIKSILVFEHLHSSNKKSIITVCRKGG
jgi:hypothetical protein